jgi:predicted HTH domain antitoxin
MSDTAIPIPDDIFEALKIPEREREQELRIELAVSLYARGALSFGKARELAGLSKGEFQRELGKREITRHYTETELDEDRRYAEG